MKRRAFLGVLSAGARAASTEPESILIHGNILTMDAANPRAQAVAIAGGRTAVPGFIDCHSHPASSGLRHLREVDCDLRSVTAIQQAIRERAAKTPPGQWILGFKYDDTKTVEGRKLTKSDLDAAAPNHPVFVNHRGGHTAYVNSVALRSGPASTKTRRIPPAAVTNAMFPGASPAACMRPPWFRSGSRSPRSTRVRTGARAPNSSPG
jgi:hypothetical protein